MLIEKQKINLFLLLRVKMKIPIRFLENSFEVLTFHLFYLYLECCFTFFFSLKMIGKRTIWERMRLRKNVRAQDLK